MGRKNSFWSYKCAVESQGMPMSEIDRTWRNMGPSERKSWMNGRRSNYDDALTAPSNAQPTGPQPQPSLHYLDTLDDAAVEELADEKWQSFVQELSLDKMHDMPFLSMSFNVALKWGNKFYPIEIGAAIYSFRKGIDPNVSSRFHRHIFPGELPTGSFFMADKHQPNHRLSIDVPLVDAIGRPPPNASSDSHQQQEYKQMMKELLDFIRPTAVQVEGKECYFIFVKGNLVKSQVKQVFGSLKFLAIKSNDEHWIDLLKTNRILVLDASALALAAFQKASDPQVVKNAWILAPQVCDSRNFKFALDIMCVFHEENESENCALAVAIRLWFFMSEALAKPLGIHCIPDQHLPKAIRSFVIEEAQPEANDEDDDDDDRTESSYLCQSQSAIRESERHALNFPLTSKYSSTVQMGTTTGTFLEPNQFPPIPESTPQSLAAKTAFSRASTQSRTVTADTSEMPGLATGNPKVRGVGRGKWIVRKESSS